MAAESIPLFALTADEADGELSNKNALKLLELAAENGWEIGPTTLVARLDKPGAEPWFIRWDLGSTAKGKKSWRFWGSRARNGQGLTFKDALLYIQHPEVIQPEPPAEEETEVNDCD